MGRPTLRLPVAALAGVAILAVGLAQSTPGRSVLRTFGLQGTPAHYTELSFTSPRALPFRFVRGGLLHLSFDIHNVEGELRLYAWRVELSSDVGAASVVDRGIELLHDGATTRVVVAERIPCRGTREQVAVRLAEPARTVRFTAGCLGSAARRRGR